MITIEQARKAALALPETVERLHFHLPGFWIGKKIFATIHADKNYVMVKLSPIDQSVFCAYDKEVIFPVPGGWGKHGATFINLKKVRKSMFLDALSTAWKLAATDAIKKNMRIRSRNAWGFFFVHQRNFK